MKKDINILPSEWGDTSYRTIALKLNKLDRDKPPVSYLCVRDIFLKTMKKIANEYKKQLMSEVAIDDIALNTEFQVAIGSYLRKLWFENQL